MPRNFRVLAAAAVLLGFLLFISRYFAAGPGVKSLWSEAPSAARILISRNGGEIELSREGNDWRILRPSSAPADGALIRDLLADVAGAALSEPLGDDPARYGVFGLEGDGEVRLRFYAGDGKEPALDFHAGKPGADPGSVFVRKEGEREVREARGLGRYRFDRAPSGWADRTICALPADSIAALEVKGAAAVLLRRAADGGGWRMDGASVSTSAAVELAGSMTGTLSGLKADEVFFAGTMAADAARALAEPEFTVIVSSAGAAGTLAELEISAADKEGRRYVRRRGTTGLVYRLYSWRLEPFLKKSRGGKRG